MSSPRDHDREHPEDDGPAGWQGPAHLGGGAPTPQPPTPQPPASQPPAPQPSTPGPGPVAWQPPGWDLPAVEPDRPGAPGGLSPVQQWATTRGWTTSDGTGPADAVLDQLVRSAPVRPAKAHRPAGVLRGREQNLDLVAFDIAFADRGRLVPQWAVTAAPVLGALPSFRLAPARFWKHRTGGLLQVPSGDDAFDLRWVLLAPEDGPQVRALVTDPGVHQVLLGSDDGDELWSAVGHVAAVRPDGQRPELVAHHTRLLAAVVGALAAAA